MTAAAAKTDQEIVRLSYAYVMCIVVSVFAAVSAMTALILALIVPRKLLHNSSKLIYNNNLLSTF